MGRKLTHEEASKPILAAGSTPIEPYPGRKVPWRCRCNTCGNISTPTRGHVMQGQGACRPCGHRNSARSRSAHQTQESAAEEFATFGWNLTGTYVGNRTSTQVTHTVCGYKATLRLDTLRSRWSPETPCCKRCSNREPPTTEKVRERFLELGVEVDPDWVYQRYDKMVPGICQKCNAATTASWHNIQQGQGPCRACAKYGYDPSKPGYLYVIETPHASGIGVSNNPHHRLKDYGAVELVHLFQHDDGAVAIECEARLISEVCLPADSTRLSGLRREACDPASFGQIRDIVLAAGMVEIF